MKKSGIVYLIVLSMLLVPSWVSAKIPSDLAECQSNLETRGDVNGDQKIDLADAINLLNYLFLEIQSPLCLKMADTDGNDLLQLTDAVLILNYLFQGGNAPKTITPADIDHIPYLSLTPYKEFKITLEKKIRFVELWPSHFGEDALECRAIAKTSTGEIELFSLKREADDRTPSEQLFMDIPQEIQPPYEVIITCKDERGQEGITKTMILPRDQFIPLQSTPPDLPSPPDASCKLRCFTIIHKRDEQGMVSSQCGKIGKVTVPDGMERMGFNFVDPLNAWKTSGVPGIGPNKGYTTATRDEDPYLELDNQMTEKIGYGFIAYGLYSGDPLKCREYQFWQAKQQKEKIINGEIVQDTRIRGVKDIPMPLNLVSGKDSKSLEELIKGVQGAKKLETYVHIITQLRQGGKALDYGGPCITGTNTICQDDYYIYNTARGSDRSNRIFTGGKYDPAQKDLKPELAKYLDSSKGILLWRDNPYMGISSSNRKEILSDAKEIIKTLNKFIAIAENEKANQKWECTLEIEMSAGGKSIEDDLNYAKLISCNCKEWTRGMDGKWSSEKPEGYKC